MILIDWIELTEFEIKWLTWIGQARHTNAIKNARDPGLGPTALGADASLRNHVRGVKCEFACSIILNQYWRPTVGEIHQRDVGGQIDVRSTDLIDGRLIVKPSDPGHVPFVLMLETGNVYRALGWLFAHEAKTFPLLTSFGDPAHFVPQASLHPIDSLRDWIAIRILERSGQEQVA